MTVSETLPNVNLEYSYHSNMYNFSLNANERIDFIYQDNNLKYLANLFDFYHILRVVRPTQGVLPAGAATLFVEGKTLLSNSSSTLFLTNPNITIYPYPIGLSSTIAFNGFYVVQTYAIAKPNSSPGQIMAMIKELAAMNDNLDASIKLKAAMHTGVTGDVLTKEEEALISDVLTSRFNKGVFSFDTYNENKDTAEHEQMTDNAVMQTNTGVSLQTTTSRSSYVYDSNNRMTREITNGISTEYTYDRNGNQRGASGGNSFTNTYNARDQLTGTVRIGVASSYTYLPNGYRYSKTVSGAVTRHVWDGANIVHDLNGSGAVVDSYLHGVGLARSTLHGNYLFNGRGDVVQLINSSGAVTRNYFYDAFGNETGGTGGTDSNPFRFNAEY
jgi:hypothetical protein